MRREAFVFRPEVYVGSRNTRVRATGQAEPRRTIFIPFRSVRRIWGAENVWPSGVVPSSYERVYGRAFGRTLGSVEICGERPTASMDGILWPGWKGARRACLPYQEETLWKLSKPHGNAIDYVISE